MKSHILKAYFHFSRRHPLPKRIEGNPYPGLRAFLPQESDRFFGRDVEIEDLIERLLVRNDRFVAVIGSSGSDKSSLVHAGLIPTLSEKSIGNMRWLFTASFSPRELGDDPFLPLAAVLSKAFPDCGWRVPDLARQLYADPACIATIAEEALKAQGANAQLLLFADQFEELFAAKIDAPTRNAFFQLLSAATASPLLRVVVAMRSDFYSQWPQDETSAALLRCGHYSVGTPGAAALEKMIVEPAKAAGLTIAPRLVQRILHDTGTAPGALTLAEFALSQLYVNKNGNELTEAAYHSISGIAGAIDGLAEEAVTRAQQDTALNDETYSRLFLAIASASVEQHSSKTDGALTVVRRRAVQQEFSESALILAQHLVERRILVSRQDDNDQPIYEVGHETVFSHWRRFQEWHALYADDLALNRQAEQAAHEWDNRQRSPVLQWSWERQKPAILALSKLHRFAAPGSDPNFNDPAIVIWRRLEPRLKTPLQQFLYPEPLRLLDELNTDTTSHQRRERIGLRLNHFGDPRCGVGLDDNGLPDIAWIDIPSGEIALNGYHSQFPHFRIARYPITWTQYRAFVDAKDGYHNEVWWQGLKKDSPGDPLSMFANYPAVNVSWYDAVAFCRWLSAERKLTIQLPNEREWQWAAVGNTRQEYPWGNDENRARANQASAGIGRTVAVGLYPLGRNLFGIDDMAGNIWQWCLNFYQPQDFFLAMTERPRVVHGGSWSSYPVSVRSSARDNFRPGKRSANVGFRVLCESPIDEELSVKICRAER